MITPRIFRTDKPSQRFGPVLPMDDVDAYFWTERRRRINLKQERKNAERT